MARCYLVAHRLPCPYGRPSGCGCRWLIAWLLGLSCFPRRCASESPRRGCWRGRVLLWMADFHDPDRSSSGGVLPGLSFPGRVLPLHPHRSARARAALLASWSPAWRQSTRLPLGRLVPCPNYADPGPAPPLGALLRWCRRCCAQPPGVVCRLAVPGRYGFNFLPYIEYHAATTTRTCSALRRCAASVNWIAYMNFGQPWRTAGS